jgi:large subunit ribosomal protein LP1
MVLRRFARAGLWLSSGELVVGRPAGQVGPPSSDREAGPAQAGPSGHGADCRAARCRFAPLLVEGPSGEGPGSYVSRHARLATQLTYFWSVSQSELAASYAALILADEGIEITADKLVALTSAAKVELEPIWATLLAKALEGKNVKELLTNVGSGGGAAPAAAVAGGASGDAPAAAEEKKEEKVEDKEEYVRSPSSVFTLRAAS